MRRSVPRTLLTAIVAVSASVFAAGIADAQEGATGGRYRVLIPNFEGQGGDRVANQVRNLVNSMATHTSIADREMRRAMSQYKLRDLDEITSRQLAAQMNAELVAWGQVQPGGQGLMASVKFVDVRSGDEIEVENATGANQNELAQAIFSGFSEKVEGIRQAAFCNDYLSSEQFERALETCDRALAIVPRSTSALYGKATAQLNLERYDDALGTYQQLLEIDPAHQDALLGAGLAASRLNQGQVAMGFYNRYLEVNPGNVQVRMTVANSVAQAGDFVNAFRVLQPAIAENQEDEDFQRYLFSVATAAGQRVQEQESREAAQEFFQAAMTAYDAAFVRGSAEMDASTLRQAIAVNTALGRTQDALRIAREATQRFDTVAAIWSQFATVLTEAGQHAEAAQALTRVIQIDPTWENAYIRRAMAYMSAGQRQQARADLDRAAQGGDRENVAKVLFSMAGESIKANNFSEAAGLLESAHGYAAGSLRNEVSFFWGYSLYKQGEDIAKANTQGNVQRAQQALRFFQQALPLVRGSNHASAAQVAGAAQQYIENQEAIIRAGQRGQ
jgi:tetratricopeptide (TPR) repeat protein